MAYLLNHTLSRVFKKSVKDLMHDAPPSSFELIHSFDLYCFLVSNSLKIRDIVLVCCYPQPSLDSTEASSKLERWLQKNHEAWDRCLSDNIHKALQI